MKKLRSIIIIIKEFILDNKLLFVVLFVTLIVRLWGARYGLPIIFNIDEPSFVRSVNGLRFSLKPNRFDWPHTHMYIHFVFFMVFYYFRAVLQFIGLQGPLSNFFPILWQDPQIFYLLSRIINAFFGAFTVIPVFLAAKELLKSKKLALMTATLFAFIPFAIEDSHRALLDTGMTFWVSVSFYFMVKILKSPTYKNYILAGAFLGLAFGTKYNAMFYWLVLAIIVLFTYAKEDFLTSFKQYIQLKNIKKYLASLTAFFGAWLFTNPTVILDWDLFWSTKYGRGFLFQFENIGTKTIQEYPASLYENFVTQSISDYGITLYIALAFLTLSFLFFSYRNKVNLITFLVPLLMYFYISSKDRNPSHYFVFLYPLISIAVVKFLSDTTFFASKLKKFINKNSKNLSTKQQSTFLNILFVIVMVSPIVGSLKYSYLFSKKDSRNLAAEYLQENLSEDDLVYYYRGELEALPEKPYDYKKLVRLDIENVDTSRLPFYLVIGVEDIEYSEIMEGNRDTSKIDGNVSRFVNNSELLFYDSGQGRFGPPVFIFKVYEVESKN